MFNYFKREIYNWKGIIISIVRTKGKAGYRVWKSAGGQGDHEMSLPLISLEVFKKFFFGADDFVPNPLLIAKTKLNINKKKEKGY